MPKETADWFGPAIPNDPRLEPPGPRRTLRSPGTCESEAQRHARMLQPAVLQWFWGRGLHNGIVMGVFCSARAYVTKRNWPTLKPGSAPPNRRRPSSRLLAMATCDQVPAQAQIRLSRPWWKSVHSMNAICIRL